MTTSDAIIDATLALLETRTFDRISLQDIADEAGIGLSALNAAFGSRGEILDAFMRRIDGEVLEGSFEDMADEPPRERLFDVLMTRLDALRPYRAALRSLMRSATRDPALALSLNALAVRSQVWMLAAAGVDASGFRGGIAAQALSMAFMRVLRIFVTEDDPGMPRTMAALDQELRRSESRHNRLARWLGPAVRARRAREDTDAGVAAGASNGAAPAADATEAAGSATGTAPRPARAAAEPGRAETVTAAAEPAAPATPDTDAAPDASGGAARPKASRGTAGKAAGPARGSSRGAAKAGAAKGAGAMGAAGRSASPKSRTAQAKPARKTTRGGKARDDSTGN
ncbi:TetR family transcriptional regulator [Acuticoccus sediminis]|uniref:TetR family transcriptional regulator n=1 Tax=Acuticoccus sediminis TaxID=2184697 RepID=UPI001CFC55CF|nr:TetR/AcrR family transcriptional regulator [Acuticoccus sediminis]